MKTVDQPALFIATQTTIPTLTGIASALCLGAVALAASDRWPQRCVPWLDIASGQVAILFLSIAAFAFLLAAHCCVNSHAWDIHAMSDARRSDWGIDNTPAYTKRCIQRCKLWHVLAASSYNIGNTTMLIGLCALFLKVAPLVSALSATILIATLAAALCQRSRACLETRENLVRRLERFLLRK
ncbi:MAG: hypothetical protein AB7S62_13485 [Azoarcus sp.]|jgi:hypothetical protein